MTWQADTRAGTVDYFLDGEKAFTDHGQKLAFAKDDNDRDELEAGLRLALAKFGPDIRLRGTDEYKAKMVQIAAEAGLKVHFSDPVLQAHYEQRREAIKAERAKPAHQGGPSRTAEPEQQREQEQPQPRPPDTDHSR